MTRIFATGGDFCPLLAMQRYLASSQHRGGGAQSVLFSYIDGTDLTRDRVNRLVKRLCAIAGFDPARYSTHSTRAGGATSLSLIGARPAVIKQLGRWKSEAYTAYIRVPDHQLRALQARMAGLPLPSTSRAVQATGANRAWAQLRTELIDSG
jgi:site-specific recombinase XerD